MEAAQPEKAGFKNWDPAEYINTKEDVISLLEVIFEDDDVDLLPSFVDDIVRSNGIANIASELNLNQDDLCKSLIPDGKASMDSAFKLLGILGLRIKLEKKGA